MLVFINFRVPHGSHSFLSGDKGSLSWTLTVHGKEVNQQKCSALSDTPKTLSIATLLSVLDKAAVCPGQPDQQFLLMLDGKLLSRNGHTVIAYVDDCSAVTLNGEKYIRYSSCEVVVKGVKCLSCVNYQDTLRKMAKTEVFITMTSSVNIKQDSTSVS